MGPAHTTDTSPRIAESLTSLDFDLESESVRATYDSTSDSTSLAVVAVVATALGGDSEALTALQTVVDTDALNELVTGSDAGSGACDRISFRYEGFEITVTPEDVIEATPVERAEPAPMPPCQDTCSERGRESFDNGTTTGDE